MRHIATLSYLCRSCRFRIGCLFLSFPSGILRSVDWLPLSKFSTTPAWISATLSLFFATRMSAIAIIVWNLSLFSIRYGFCSASATIATSRKGRRRVHLFFACVSATRTSVCPSPSSGMIVTLYCCSPLHFASDLLLGILISAQSRVASSLPQFLPQILLTSSSSHPQAGKSWWEVQGDDEPEECS